MSSYDDIRKSLRQRYGSENTVSVDRKKDEDSYEDIRTVLRDKYSDENVRTMRNSVSDWAKRYDEATRGWADFDSKRNNGFARDIGGGFNQEIESLIEEYESIKSYADRMGLPNAKRYVKELENLQSHIQEGNKYFSQWDTEADYLDWKREVEEYEALKSFDIQGGEKEIGDLEKILNEYKALSRTMIDENMEKRLEYLRTNYGGENGIKSLIADKKQYLNRAKRLQEGITMAGVINNDDFQANSGYVSTKTEGTWNKITSDFGMGYDDLTYEYINGEENGLRQEIINKAVAYDHDTDKFFVYDHMTEDQIATYNYYYARDGKEAAEKYLDSIQKTLNYQAASERYEKMEGKTALELMFGIEAGVDQFQSGMKNLFNTEDDYIAQTATQMVSGMVREDLADNGPKLPEWLGGASLAQAGYDAITTTSNMAPSVMTSTVLNIIAPGSGAVVGTAMMGASAAGNAYQEMLNLGYDKSQARAYSTLVGASEAGLQYLLGGISNLGGKITGNALAKMMKGIDNAFLRTALKLGGNMLSEGLEEGLQEVLTPWFQNLIMHTDENVNWSEVAYSTLLGALTAGVMEGHTTIGDAVSIRNTGKQLQNADISATRLAEIGKTFSADTVAYQLAGRVNENTGAYTMGRLFNEIGATLSEQNITEITNALVAKGMDESTAKKNAKALAYVVEGGQLTDMQIAAIEANEVLADVARTTLIDANTTWNQRTNALKALADEMTAPKASRTNPAQQSQENAPTTDTVATQNKEGAQSLSEAVDTSPAKVQTISKIENGQVTVKLEDGTEINAKQADLSVDDGVRIETIAKLDGISPADANFILNTLRTNTNASAQMDSLGAREAYKYGFYGFSTEHMTTHGVFSNSLTEAQRKAIYETGRSARQRQVEVKQATAKAKTQLGKEKSTGKVHFEGDRSTLTERQSASLTAMEKVADALGVQIYVFESEVNERGQRVGANGWYDPKDNSIHIDLHAGANGEGTMLFTAAHELTHFIRQWSPAKFKTLADFLMQEYGKKGVNVDALVREQMAKAKRNGRTISYDTAYEEVVADSMEMMLADGNVMEKLAKLKAQDKSLWQKVKDFINELAAKIRAVYDGMAPDSVEGRHVAEMVDAIERLQELFTEGLVDASNNFQSAEKNTTQEGGEVKYSQKYLEADMNSEILAMVTKVANGDFKANEKVYLGNVTDAIADQISKLTGIQVNGFRIAIEARQIDHILKGHGVNGNTDHSMADPNDIAKMEYALDNPDDIRKSGKTQAYTYMRNGRNRTADTILYEKKIGAKSYYVVQAVPETKAKTLYIVTAFIGPSGYKKEASQLINAKGPDATVKTGSANASNESIRIGSEIVKNESIADNFVKEYKDSHKGVKYYDRDSRTYAEIEYERQALRQREMMLEERKRKAVNDPELLQAMDAYSGLFTEIRELLSQKRNGTATQAELDRIEEIKHLREESMKRVTDLQESLGLNAISQEETEIRETKEALRIASDAAWAREGAEKENKAIEKAGVSAPEYFRKKALKAFKTTTNFNEAGYLLPDGKLLNFSGGERNHRYRDHREIGEIYEATQGAAALNRFMSDGNIRIMAESPGVDITSGIEPTNEQYAALRKFVNSHGVKERKFFVDFSDADGHRAGNYSYEGRVNADRVINDIKHYYATGEIREQSSVAQFLWSDRDFPSNAEDIAKEHFGITKKWSETGWLLRDGTQLDFSGRHWERDPENEIDLGESYYSGKRNMEHYEIAEAFPELREYSRMEYRGEHLDRFLNRGNIRIVGKGIVDIETMPTEAQFEKLLSYFRENIDRGIVVGIGRGVLNFNAGTNPSIIVEGIMDYFSYNRKNQSELMRFHTMFSDRDTESVSNRSLLANAFDGVAQNDIERQKIHEYKGKISLIEAEERKLQKLNEQIKDLSFSKGPKDTKAIRDLQFEAKQTANRISTYDKQLLRLEASKPLQDVLNREKKLAYQRAEKKGKEALEAYREKTMKYQQELIDKWQESRKKGIENREKTAMRHKIQNVVGELNNLLLSNDKKRHVPDSLKKAVADALDLVNMDTVGAEERAAKYAALIANETDPDKIDAYTTTMENILRQGEKMGKRLKELHDAYEEIQNSDDPDIANAYDPVIAGAIKELSQTVGKTSLRNMTLEQLSDVYDVYRMVLTRVRDANKSLLDNIKESISNLASRVIGEVRMTGGEHKTRATILDPVKKFMWNNMKPVYAMEYIGSSTLTKVFNNVRSGEDMWAKDVTEAREYYLDKYKKYGYDSWDFKKKYRFQSASDLEFELTLEQILSLYAYSKREQAHDHLRLGGFVFDSNIETYKDKGSKLIKYKVNTADAHQISPEILANIIGTLSNDQKGFVDEMQDYLSTVMGAKGNEVTSKMYGVKLFKEKFYFPLKSAKQFMFEQNEVSGEVKIKNSGFTNKVVAKANNPVILSNFMEVWSGHVNDMSMYHAFTLPLEDFNRVFNYNSPKKENQPSVSVKGTIQNAYSPAAVHYVKQLITDLNGGARSDSTTGIINKLMGLFKKGSVFASLSVVVQQPSAIARAAALVDTKYFIGPKVDHKRHKALWDEVKQYAPVAIIKEMGYFDTNMGKSTQDFILGKEYSGFKDKMKALVTDSGFRDEALSKAPALADELAWCSIWEAVKRETKAKHPGLDTKAEPFLMLCGSRFTEVITKTQVYDSVLSRSGHMRSKDTGMKMATAFMAEPTTSINMIIDALLKGKRGNRKYARGAIGAVIASQILNSILVSFVYAGRDDDKDETYWEKYIGTLSGQALDSLNPAGYIPFIKDIMSIVQGYDVERSDMAVISDLWKAWENLSKDYISPYRKVEGFVGSVAQIFGLPVKNIMRDARGIYQTIDSFVNGQQTTKAGIGYAVKGAITGKTVSNDQQLYESIISGDQTQIDRVKGRYEDQSSINSAIRKGLRENDSRIYEAALAQINGHPEERVKLQRQVIADGFKQDDVVAATNTLINKLSPSASASEPKKKGLYSAEDFALFVANGKASLADEAKKDIVATHQLNGKTADEAEKSFQSSAKTDLKEMFLAGTVTVAAAEHALKTYCGMDAGEAKTKVNEWNYFKTTGVDYSDKREQFLAGEMSASELVKALVSVEGKTKEEAAKTVVSYTRDAYEDGLYDRSKAADAMVTYGGLTDEEAEAKLRYIDVKQQFPNTYVDDAWVAEYYNEVESSGISIEVFVDYRNRVKSMTGEGKKEKRMAVINSMPISDSQKDALYYAEGWAASRLHEAPWR